MFVAILTDNGTVHLNINHIVKVAKENNNVQIQLSDGQIINTHLTLEGAMRQIGNAIKPLN